MTKLQRNRIDPSDGLSARILDLVERTGPENAMSVQDIAALPEIRELSKLSTVAVTLTNMFRSGLVGRSTIKQGSGMGRSRFGYHRKNGAPRPAKSVVAVPAPIHNEAAPPGAVDVHRNKDGSITLRVGKKFAVTVSAED